MGGGKSSGSSQTQVQLTPEQRETLAIQNAALRDTFIPAYQKTIGGAGDVYNKTAGKTDAAVDAAMNVSGAAASGLFGTGGNAFTNGTTNLTNILGYQQAAGQKGLDRSFGSAMDTADGQRASGAQMQGQGAGGMGDLAGQQRGAGTAMQGIGASGLASLFDKDYERNQIFGALQAGRESARESLAGQNAMYGAAGGLGSARHALADTNMASLNAQRQATAAAGAQAQVQQNRSSAANSLLGAGQNALGQSGSLYTGLMQGGQNAIGQALSTYGNVLGQSANMLDSSQRGNTALSNIGSSALKDSSALTSNRVGISQAPQDLYGKYASVIYGTPQGNTTPNYAGTQGSSQSGGSKGFKI